MDTLGYEQCKMDPCVFIKARPGQKLLSIGVHVDDGILVCDTFHQKDELFKGIEQAFWREGYRFPQVSSGLPVREKA